MRLDRFEQVDLPINQIIQGRCEEVMRRLPENSIDTLITDPPYGLSEQRTEDIVKCLRAWLAGEVYHHGKSGFMGKEWDAFVPGPEVWREALRVCKPGACALVFASSRTVDLMGLSLRLAGWEIKDTICWLYASGMTHALDISKAIDKEAGAEREIIETGKPVALMRYLCRITRTPAGGIVLDPFCGTGTTLFAAREEGRKFIGIDKEEEAVQEARKRCAQETLF